MKNPIKASIRKAIILHHTEGMSYRGTVHQLCGFDVTKNQVEYTVKKFCESNSIEEVILDKKRSGRLKSVRSPEVIRTVKQFIEVSTKISIEKYWTRDCVNFVPMRAAVSRLLLRLMVVILNIFLCVFSLHVYNELLLL